MKWLRICLTAITALLVSFPAAAATCAQVLNALGGNLVGATCFVPSQLGH